MSKGVSLNDSDPRLGGFPRKMSSVVRAAAVAAPLLALSATLQPQETSAKTAQVGGEKKDLNTVRIRGEINTNNCLSVGQAQFGFRNNDPKQGLIFILAAVLVVPCQHNADQTNWVFVDNKLIDLARPTPQQCVTAAGSPFSEDVPLKMGPCDHTALRWEYTGGKFMTHDNLCLDARDGPRNVAVLRGCAAELGAVRDPRRTDQYWSLAPS